MHMYVATLHSIDDPELWAKKLVEFEELEMPGGTTNPISYIGSATDYAFCLYDAPSVDHLKSWLDDFMGSAAHQMYFEVDPNAFGTYGIPA
jgi:hypothetical protein